MDLGELSDVFEHLGSTVANFRAVGELPAHLENYIYLAAVGPCEMSTDTAMVPMTALSIWDVNGYYRSIGIAWPYRPTRKQMRESYRDTGGSNDAYATYAFKRLLDPEFRRRYDRRKLGDPMDDDYRIADAMEMLSDVAAKLSKNGRPVTYHELLGEDLVERMAKAAEDERRDLDAKREEREAGQDFERPEAEAPFIWPYAYFLWDSRKYDDVTLSDWQRMLHQSCIREGLSLRIAVGYLGPTSGAATARVRHPKPGGGYVEILFLGEDIEPTQERADVVVGTFHTHPYGTVHDPLYQY